MQVNAIGSMASHIAADLAMPIDTQLFELNFFFDGHAMFLDVFNNGFAVNFTSGEITNSLL